MNIIELRRMTGQCLVFQQIFTYQTKTLYNKAADNEISFACVELGEKVGRCFRQVGPSHKAFVRFTAYVWRRLNELFL
jgi:hypothetical protein